MSGLLALKQRLRRRSEYFLRLVVLRDLGVGQPATTAPYSGGADRRPPTESMAGGL